MILEHFNLNKDIHNKLKSNSYNILELDKASSEDVEIQNKIDSNFSKTIPYFI
jgi:hypothetical protein